jgi:CRP-like cAMP-binding protein
MESTRPNGASKRVAEVARSKNRLLAALPPTDFDRILPDVKTVVVRQRQVLQHAGEQIRHVYFPNGGVFSVTTVLPDGTMVEAATVGDEGMFCIEAFLHENAIAPGHAILQVSDTNVMRLDLAAFRREVALRGALYDLVGRYATAAVAQMMQSAACNALHHVQQRCARWLLMTHDRMHRPDFHLSHEFLAVMLGTRRPTVTLVACALQEAGLITYKYGHVTVLNRTGLEAAACPCYPSIREHSSGSLRHTGSPAVECRQAHSSLESRSHER